MTRYFIDAEFHEDGPRSPIEIISLAVVSDDGRELYMENMDYDQGRATDWLKQNVLSHLNPLSSMSFKRMGPVLKHFIADAPIFWGYYADYDWVVLCQLFGRMIDLPKGWPRYCRDLKQWADMLGVTKEQYPPQASTEHHALNDARWNKQLYHFLVEHARSTHNQL